MAHFVHQLVEAATAWTLLTENAVLCRFLSAMVDDCIGRGKSLQEGGAIYNFTGPLRLDADTGDSVYAIQKQVFKDRRLTLQELKSAFDANFGHPVGVTRTRAEVNPLWASRIFIAVGKRIDLSSTVH